MSALTERQREMLEDAWWADEDLKRGVTTLVGIDGRPHPTLHETVATMLDQARAEERQTALEDAARTVETAYVDQYSNGDYRSAALIIRNLIASETP